MKIVENKKFLAPEIWTKIWNQFFPRVPKDVLPCSCPDQAFGKTTSASSSSSSLILLQKFLTTRNILARAAQKILNISTIFHNFTKKFSINWRAQRGKFFEYIIVLSGFFFRNSILILNKLARAARKIFSYIIDFSRFS